MACTLQLAVALVPVDGLTATAVQAVVVELPIVALKVTVPVGTADRFPVTVAPNVIAAPVAEGLAEEVTATVDDPGRIDDEGGRIGEPGLAQGDGGVAGVARVGGHE